MSRPALPRREMSNVGILSLSIGSLVLRPNILLIFCFVFPITIDRFFEFAGELSTNDFAFIYENDGYSCVK